MDDSFCIAAARVSLVTVPTLVLEGCVRSTQYDLVARTTLDDSGRAREVVYPAGWPGDAIQLIPAVLARRKAGEMPETILGAIVDRALGVAVGNMGTHGPPDCGRVEVDYGMLAAYEGHGYATEMLRAFTSWLLARDDVVRVAAESLASNFPSMRVLEKCGYVRVGTRVDDEGPLVRWARSAGA